MILLLLMPCPRMTLIIRTAAYLHKAGKPFLTQCSGACLPADCEAFPCSPRLPTLLLGDMVKGVMNGKQETFPFECSGRHLREHLGAL